MATYAIIETGGKQYRVQRGDLIRVESAPTDVGISMDITNVLMVVDEGKVKFGNPRIAGAIVRAEVVEHGKNKKVTVFKYKAKTRYRKKNGHRQNYTDLSITDIVVK